MSLKENFPASLWTWRVFTGRLARRVYAIVLLLMFVTSVIVRAYSYVLTRRIHAVISALSKLRIDETSQDEVLRTVPYLVRGRNDWQLDKNVELGEVEKGLEQSLYVLISNNQSWTMFDKFASRFSNGEFTKDGKPRGWIFAAADLLGCRYIGFSAMVTLLNGKVSSIRYGIADNLTMPQAIGNLVSVQSVHARWAPHQMDFEVSSIGDESPQFDVEGDDRNLRVVYTAEASPSLKTHIFHVNLRCFWSLFRCDHARQVAPLLWQDKNDIEAATLVRLQSNDPCPDRILTGRMKYLPDINVFVLESTGFETKEVNEDGGRADEIWTHYKLIEILRGRVRVSWESVRNSPTILYPGDYTRKLPNMGLQWAAGGERVLAFQGPFDSCSIVRATPSALSAVRNAIPAPRRAEDMRISGLL